MEKRLGFVGIIVEDRDAAGGAINAVLADHVDLIVARVGLPNARRECSVVTLIVDATPDEVGTLTGKLGMITGVSVKSALSKAR